MKIDSVSRLAWLPVIPLLLLVMWLGARSLDADALWYDEERSVYDAGGGSYGALTPVEIWQRVATRNPWHTPGYFILLGSWGSLVGWTPFAARSLSLLLGLLAVALTYRAGTELFSRRVGLNAAIILGASAFFVLYLHELRLYTLYAMLVALAIWLYWRIVNGKIDAITQVGFVLSVVGILYTHYFASLAVAGVALYHLIFMPKRRSWWRGVILMGIGGAAFLPWFNNVLLDLFGGVAGGGESSNAMLLHNDEIVRMVFYALANGLIVLWLIPVAFALPRLRSERGLRLLLLMAICVLALALVVNAITAVIPNIRYVMGLFPVMALFCAYGVERLARFRPAREVFLIVWIVLGVFHSIDPTFNDDLYGQRFRDFFRPYLRWDVLADAIHDNLQTGDAVAFSAPIHAWTVGSVFEYYMDWLPVRYTMMDWLPGEAENDEYYNQARRYIVDYQRVWVGEEHSLAPADFRLAEFERALTDDGFGSCGDVFDHADIKLSLYARQEVCCFPPSDLDGATLMQFGDGIRLTYMSELPDNADETFTITMAWAQAESVPDNTYSAALHLVDASGELVTQADYGLPPDDFACHVQTIPLPDDLAPGEYTLMTTVYNWSNGERLLAQSADGEQGERLPLGTFEIAD